MKPKLILFVEDDDNVRAVYSLVKRHLPKHYVLHPAATAEIAWSKMEDTEFDVIVSDLNLPGMSGRQLFLKTIDRHKIDPNFKMPDFIFCSGMEAALENLTDDPKKYGYKMLVKPFLLEDLAEAILSFEK